MSRHRRSIASARPNCTGIEPLEERIAPASLLNGRVLSYTDIDGDHVTVTVSKALFTAANANKIFTFDHGSVNHRTNIDQQLETIDLSYLGSKAKGVTLTVAVHQAGSGDGFANVGFIDASGIDLGTVTIHGDLGRIDAGDSITHTPGLAKLAVQSMGEDGTATQAPGGTLVSMINGGLTALSITGDLDGAAISVGAANAPDGGIGSIEVGGSILGGSAAYSGSIRATGAIGPVHVGGDVRGGSGPNSGVIGAAGQMGTVNIDGSVNGGGGTGSGAILSTGNMGMVTIGGNLVGGNGANSGNIATAGTLAGISIDGEIEGGALAFSGAVLSTGNMGAVKVTGDIVGGAGSSSGQVGSGGNITCVSAGNLTGAVGDHSGGVFAVGNIGPVTVTSLQAGGGTFSGAVGAGGTLGDVQVNGSITGNTSISAGSIFSGGTMGTVTATSLSGAQIYSGGGIGDITVSQFIEGSLVTAVGDIGNIYVNLDRTSTVGIIDGSTFQAGGSIGNITCNTGPNLVVTNNSSLLSNSAFPQISPVIAISDSTFLAGASIGNIMASATGIPVDDAISGSVFAAGQNIGNLTLYGNLTGSLLIAGVNFGSSYSPDLGGAGSFNDTAAFGIGSGTAAGSAATIGSITMMPPSGSPIVASISNTTILAGITGSNSNGDFGTIGDQTISGSGVGAITAGALSNMTVEGGSIGTVTATGISGSNFIATDSGGNGLGDVNAGTSASFGPGISSSYFLSNAGIGNISSYSTGNAISGSIFQANGGIGSITAVTSDISGQSHAITASGFNAGGSIGDIAATGDISGSLFVSGLQLAASFAGNLSGTGTVAYGYGSVSVLAYNYSGANIGSITVTAVPGSTASTAPGISHSTFMGGVQYNYNGGGFGLGSDFTPGSSSIGNITAPGGLDTVFLDSGSIGSTTIATGGIANSQYAANNNGQGGIGALTVGQVANSGHAIDSSTFISNDVFGAIDAEAPGRSSAIVNSHFRAANGFGDLTAVSQDAAVAIDNSIFTTGGSIGDVNVTGGISSSQILAGVDLGSAFSFGPVAAYGGTSIGNVTVSGIVTGTDIVASVLPYNLKFTYGNRQILQDTNVGAGGSIGVVSLDTSDSSPTVTVQPYANSGETNGIEAYNIASASIGAGGTVAVPVTGGGSEVQFGPGPVGSPGDEAIREIAFFG